MLPDLVKLHFEDAGNIMRVAVNCRQIYYGSFLNTLHIILHSIHGFAHVHYNIMRKIIRFEVFGIPKNLFKLNLNVPVLALILWLKF